VELVDYEVDPHYKGDQDSAQLGSEVLVVVVIVGKVALEVLELGVFEGPDELLKVHRVHLGVDILL